MVTGLALERSQWHALTHEEVSWWDMWLKTKGGDWPKDFLRRTNFAQPLEPRIEQALTASNVPRGASVKILDIGSGPLTNIGAQSAHYDVDILAIDPLADEYNRLLDLYGIEPPNRSIKGEAEQLDSMFPDHSFDIVWARNSLDHSYNPLLGLHRIFKVLKVGGQLILTFHRNEADQGNYQGLHNWNFDMREDEFIVEHRGNVVNVFEILRPFTEIDVLLKQDPNAVKSQVIIAFKKCHDFSAFEPFLENQPAKLTTGLGIRAWLAKWLGRTR